MSVYIFLPYISALSASPTLSWQNLGMNDTITVVLVSVVPIVKVGRWKSYMVYTKLKFLSKEPF